MSLLELILALALTVVVFAIAGNAIHFQLHRFAQRRDRVEQSQLARAILRHISNDLRASLVDRPVDTTGLDTVSQQGAAALGGALPGATSNTSAAGGNQNATGASGAAANQPTAEQTTSYKAGFYGDAYSLQFDMTRLPRLDEYDPVYAADGTGRVNRVPADIRTVSYHLSGDALVERLGADDRLISSTAISASNLGSAGTQSRGLLRSEEERSLAASGSMLEIGGPSTKREEELAQVMSVEFRYFDGYEWWPDWNSDDRGGVPMAVEILLTLPESETTTSEDTTSNATLSTSGQTVYRLVVALPCAKPLSADDAPKSEESEESTTPAVPSSNSGASP